MEYNGIPLKRNMEASLIQGLPVLPVGMAMNTQAVEHDKAALPDL